VSVKHGWRLFLATASTLALGLVPVGAQVDLATDVNPDPDIFEAYLTADEQDVTINGVTVHAMVYKDDPPGGGVPPRIPAPELRLKVGDLVILHFRNDLDTESASIHWHGIELDNDSDGTAVTQDAVLPGQSYVYKFRTFRPGVFWYHSHMLPGNATFAGMYGSIIISNYIEPSLQGNVLPSAANTHTLVLSDIEFDPATGVVGKPLGGVITPINEIVELCHLNVEGEPGGDGSACGAPTPGSTVLVNGVPPDPGAETPKFVVASGQRIRLQLINAAITRHFRLKLIGSGDNKLYRIGGEGGLLDNVILDGGTKSTWDTKYDLGEVAMGSGERSDVIIVPSGSDGDIIRLVGNSLPGPFNLSGGLPADYPIAYFQISGTSTDIPPAVGDPILAGTAEDIENLKDDPLVDPFIDPAPFGGSSDETIRITNARPDGQNQSPSIDGFSAALDGNVGNGDFLNFARPQTARYTNVGDLIEVSVRNETAATHPFHLHGFSMQPVRVIENAGGTTIYEFEYDEFIDSMDVYGNQTFVFRARIDDRPKICDESPSSPPGPVLAECSGSACGGVVGRWLFHCHIFHHAGLGMMGEITVMEGEGAPPEITCPADMTVNTEPGLCSAVVNFEVTATDDCGDPAVVCVPPSGSVFPKGTTTVTCTATDSDGLTAECSFDVTIEDSEAPQVTSALAIGVLTPVNHKMMNVGLSVTATDNCPGVLVDVAVFGDEDDETATGDGVHSPDALDIAPDTLRLREERKGDGDGRVYLIVVTATDESGNTAFSCETVVVPKAKSAEGLASVLSQAEAARAYCEANNGSTPPGFVVVGDGPIIGPLQ